MGFALSRMMCSLKHRECIPQSNTVRLGTVVCPFPRWYHLDPPANTQLFHPSQDSPNKARFLWGRGGFSISYWLTWIVDFNSSKSLLGQNIQNQFKQGYGLLCSVPIMQWLSAKLRRVLPPPCPNMHKYLLLQSRMCVKWAVLEGWNKYFWLWTSDNSSIKCLYTSLIW